MTIDIKRCVKDIADRSGTMSKEDQVVLEQRLRGTIQRFVDGRDNVNLQEALQREIDKISEEQILAGKIAKRNAYLNFVARQETVTYIKRAYADNPLRGVTALLVGVQSIRQGSRASVGAAQDALMRTYHGGLLHDLQRGGYEDLVKSGTLDREIADYMFLKNDPEKLAERSFSTAVKEVGDIFSKWQEVSRRDANDAGAYIRELKEYITRQSHDMNKVRRAGFDEWKEYTMTRLDMDRMKDVLEVAEGETFEDALNRYLKNVHKAIARGDYNRTDKVATKFGGGVNVGKAMSHTRKLHFKSGGDWYDYNQKFGQSTLRESVLWGLASSARHTATMRVLGPNPEDNLLKIRDMLKDTIEDDARAEKFIKAFDKGGSLQKFMDNLSGVASVPVSSKGAQYTAMARAIETMSKLGGATISAVSDLPIFAARYARVHGSWIEGLGIGFHSLASNIGLSKADKNELAYMTGVFSDATIGTVAARMGGELEIPGKVSNAVNTFFKLNGLHWWTDSLKQGFTAALSRQLANRRGSSFDDLPGDLREIFGVYNISRSDWDLARKAETHMFRDHEMFTIEGIGNLPDEVIAESIADRIAKIKERGADSADFQIQSAIRKKRSELQQKFQQYFADRAEHAVITPDKKTQTWLNQGTRPGTLLGELTRIVTQFKAFPVTILQKGVGSELFMRGVEFDDMNKMGSIGKGASQNMLGVARMALVMSAFGYMAMSTKDFLKGRKPRDPFDPQTVRDSFLQGGSAGLIGDFLFNPVPSRVGGGLYGVAGGPILGDMAGLYDGWQEIMSGEAPSGVTARKAMSMIPGQNLFYARPVIDYMLMHDLNEALSPGYLRRAERRLERDQGVEYFAPPSERPTAGLIGN